MQFLFVAQEGGEFQQISSLEIFKIELRARFCEVVQGRPIGGQGLGLLGELGFVQELSDQRY
jgi:hypothetical protein